MMSLVDTFFNNSTALQVWENGKRVLSDDENKAFNDMINFLHFIELLAEMARVKDIHLEDLVSILGSDLVVPKTGFATQDDHLARLRLLFGRSRSGGKA